MKNTNSIYKTLGGFDSPISSNNTKKREEFTFMFELCLDLILIDIKKPKIKNLKNKTKKHGIWNGIQLL